MVLVSVALKPGVPSSVSSLSPGLRSWFGFRYSSGSVKLNLDEMAPSISAPSRSPNIVTVIRVSVASVLM